MYLEQFACDHSGISLFFWFVAHDETYYFVAPRVVVVKKEEA